MDALETGTFTLNGDTLRTVIIEGNTHVVLADLARMLGYNTAKDAGRILRDHHQGWAIVPTLGGPQRMLTVNEQGINRLLIRSNAKDAEQVQDWLTDEVMPSIRATGSYVVPEAPEMLVARALVEASNMLTAAKTQVAELTPRAEAWDQLAAAAGDYEVADAAKILARAGIETGRGRLFAKLADLSWIYRSPNGSWKARQTAVDLGYLAEKPQSHYHPGTGDLVIDPPQVRVTVKGIEKLRQRLSKPLDLTA